MLYDLLSATADKTRSVPISEAALLALLGFLTVFLGIAFLILIVWLVGKIMVRATKPKVVKQVEAPAAPIEASVDEVSEETVAVITAAIMAYYERTNRKCEFTVKRIKRL